MISLSNGGLMLKTENMILFLSYKENISVLDTTIKTNKFSFFIFFILIVKRLNLNKIFSVFHLLWSKHKYVYLGFFCSEITFSFQKSLGSLIFLSPLHPPQPMAIGPLVNTKHGISTGDILIADTQTIVVPNFNYDDTGKGTLITFHLFI